MAIESWREDGCREGWETSVKPNFEITLITGEDLKVHTCRRLDVKLPETIEVTRFVPSLHKCLIFTAHIVKVVRL